MFFETNWSLLKYFRKYVLKKIIELLYDGNFFKENLNEILMHCMFLRFVRICSFHLQTV